MQRVQLLSKHVKGGEPSLGQVLDAEDFALRQEVGIIGDNNECAIALDQQRNKAYVPQGFLNMLRNTTPEQESTTLSALQFLMQKDVLAQDSFLIGPPGAYKRRLAMAYCELAGREVEYLAISQDSTVSDIKQRREIRAGNALFEDSAAVRAAIHGRVLILEGVEKAERNILSVINNLLENREMSLEDGRFLTNPKRYDEIVSNAHERKDVQLVRVSDKFRVICLGVPVPEYEGNPLDPPFRSRFQCKDVVAPCAKSELTLRMFAVKQALDHTALGGGLEGVSTIKLKRNSLPHEFDRFVVALETMFPEVNPRFAIGAVFPFPQLPSTDVAHRGLILETYKRFGFVKYPNKGEDEIEFRDRVLGPKYESSFGYSLQQLENKGNLELEFTSTKSTVKYTLQGHGGGVASAQSDFVPGVSYQNELLTEMLALYCIAEHSQAVNLFTLVGNRGVGKTCLLKQFARTLNVDLISFPLHRDMTAQDLFLRRGTRENGDTVWHASPLLQALELGSVLVLDGVESLLPSTLSTLSSLLTDRFAALPDGTRIVAGQHKLLPTDRVLHPKFRIICVGRPVSTDGRAWMTSEVMSCCIPFVWCRPLTIAEERVVIHRSSSPSLPQLDKLFHFAEHVRMQKDDQDLATLSLSTRQLIRISRRITAETQEGELADLVRNACLWRFLPILTRTSLDAALERCGIQSFQHQPAVSPPVVHLLEQPKQKGHRIKLGTLHIGSSQCDILQPRNEHEKSLIPDTYFVENPRQSRILSEMLTDYTLGSHLLLVGNQGTGKNKLVDRLLFLLKLPREYIQLDRDSTVGALTSQPIVEHGVIRYEDSPLVRAARFGRILVIDEADKAPTHVTAVLKSLLSEDGEMLLADGRRLVSRNVAGSGDNVIPVHPDFRAIVLANRVGFPFLGNDFFRETGDVFAPFAVENPDEESEIALLREYAPKVPEETLRKLSKAFQDLRALVNEGKLLYPYSTRELVNAVKHMEAFPKDGIATTMQNVFDFDRYAVEDRKTISTLFERHGIPIGMQSRFKVRTGEVAPLPDAVLTQTWKPAAAIKQQPTFVIHAIEWKDQIFPMQPATAGPTNLSRVEHRANTFDEQVFAFNLPTSELHSSGAGVVGAAMLKNSSSLVVASNDTYNALRFYSIPSTFQTYTAVDLTVPHFNFRGEYIPSVRKPAPSRCLLFPLPGGDGAAQLGMYTHEDQSVFVLDLVQHTFRMFTVDLAVFRSGRETSAAAGRNLFVERTKTILVSDLCEDFGVLIAYQQDSQVLLFYDLLANVRTTVQLPFPLALVDVTSPFSFLLRASEGQQLQFVLTAHTPSSSAESASTALALAGAARLTYTKFTLQRIEKYDMVTEQLHGQYSFVCAQPMDSSWQVKLEHAHTEQRFMRSPGTVCQVAEGFAQTFTPSSQQGRETLIKSVLRTHTTSKNVTILASSPMQLRGTSLLCSLYVNPKKKRKQGRQQSSGYLGFDPDAVLEVVDLQQRTLRHVIVALPETNKRRGSAVLHEKFEPDAEDDEEEEEENAELGVLSLDEANAQVLRQRAPFLFLFQTAQGDVLTLDRTGQGRMFQVDQTKLDQALENWKQVVGEYANNDDLDMDDGEEYDDEEDNEEDEEDYGDDENDEAGDFEEEDDNDDQEEQPNSGGGKAQKGSKRKSGKKSKSGGKKRRGKPRRPNGPPSRRSGSGEGEGKGQGSGQGKGGGQGSGSGAGGSGQLPEPGQFRGPRPLSARDRVIAEERLAELRRLTRYFPNDRGLQEELESMEQRIDEANEAERLGRGERGATMEDEETARLASLRKRLEKVEAEIAAALKEKRDVTRLRAEAAQLRQLIDKLLSGEGAGGGKRSAGSGKAPPAQLDEEARKQAKKMEKEAWKEVLETLDANPQDSALYQRYKDSIASEVRELRATLEQMHAKKNERVWLNNKDVGDLDDRKLVDGLTGERNIYKRRGERPPDPFAFQEHPKRITFLFDVSSSMSRYSMDGRLERSLECATMAMEALRGFEHKFSWKIKGHSGGTDDITFVEPNKYPKDDAAKLEVLRRMNAHADSCGSGDNTLEATKLAIREITKEQGDEYFTILFSDANIEQYDIKPADLKALLDQDERVNVFIVFIGSMGAQAERLRAELPQDKVFVTLTTAQIPAVLKRIFLSSVLKE